MNWSSRCIKTSMVLLLLAASGREVGAQPFTGSSPRLGYVYPAGVCQGSTVQLTLGGQFLDGITNVFLSGAAVSAKVIRRDAPITQGQINQLRDEMRQLTEKRRALMKQNRGRSPARLAQTNTAAWTAADMRALADIQRKIESFQRQPSSPAIADTLQVELVFRSNTAPGKYELRVQGPRGLSNPVTFCVDTLTEWVEPPPAQENFAGQFRKSRIANEQTAVKSRPENKVTLPVTVNGQIFPSETDRYRFKATKGQHIVAVVRARELIPYLADAVPGWFQATLNHNDARGREIAYSDDYRFQPDPVIHFEVPVDGEYVLEIKDAIFRGREDFVYRLAIGELPFITGIFPLGGPVGQPVPVQLAGWNLPQTWVTNFSDEQGAFPLELKAGTRCSNVLPWRADKLPHISETEPKGKSQQPQKIRLSCIVDGRIDEPGDLDFYCFSAEAGEEIVLEVMARRLMSPMDSTIQLMDAEGTIIAANDDYRDPAIGLQTHHADSYLLARMPKKGTYVVQVTDAQRQGGSAFAYRLRVSTPQPDFELRLAPSSITGRPGLSYPLTCYAIRRDGFKGEIKLALDEAPAGFSLAGAVIPAGEDSARFTIALPANAGSGRSSLNITGSAKVNSTQIIRKAVPVEDMMQAFFYRHLVPTAEFDVCIAGRSWMRNPLRLSGPARIGIPAGGTAKVTVSGSMPGLGDRLELALNQPPQAMEISRISSTRNEVELTLKAGSGFKPGTRGTLIVDLVPGGAGAGKGKGNSARAKVPVGSLPAIQYEILPAKEGQPGLE